MRINDKFITSMLETLDEVRSAMNKSVKARYPFSEWENKRKLVQKRLRNLPKLLKQAANMVKIDYRTGRHKEHTLFEQSMILLFSRMMNKSNRDMENLLGFFYPLFGIDMSYKSVERLYSDAGVQAVIHNLFILLLSKEEISGDLSGDGTGYSLTIEHHYRKNPRKEKGQYIFVFRMIDIDTGLYVGYGYSNKSEMDAFNRAMDMVSKMGIEINSVSLDRYYSSKKVVEKFEKDVALYLIPKKNMSHFSTKWTEIIQHIHRDPVRFLLRYFKRNLSESAFSADKRRFGWTLRQKREDRRETSLFLIGLLHNLFSVRGIS